MTTHDDPTGSQAPSEEELRAAYEQEIKKVRVEHIVLDQIVTLINLGMRRTGLAPGTEDERDREQVHLAIEAVRALLPTVETLAPRQSGPIRDALSQLQLAFVRIGGAPAPAAAGSAAVPPPPAPSPPPGQDKPSSGEAPAREPQPPRPGEPGPAQRSGRLWVPGQ